jgi:hypothetical protein
MNFFSFLLIDQQYLELEMVKCRKIVVHSAISM